MDKIEVKILNPSALSTAETMMVCVARLTQKGHKIKNMQDFIDLYNKPFGTNTIETMCKLPHPTIQKFAIINVAIVGASRRFLAQITRHQNEVKFMSASLQYSNYSGGADFVVPYNLLDKADERQRYLDNCAVSMEKYTDMVNKGLSNDEAGYIAPQGLRNILIISATPYQWKHMINQRICRRNTLETRYIMLRIWEALQNIKPIGIFNIGVGCFCIQGLCKEGKMSCGKPIDYISASEIIKEDFPLLCK